MDFRDLIGAAMAGGFQLGPPAVFDEMYRCYSMAMSSRPEAEQGDKIILPPSALHALTQMHVKYPMMFRLANDGKHTHTHTGVLEFSAEEGRVYVPHWIMSNLLLNEGGLVSVRNVQLPLASFVKFQPHTKDFTDLSNPKAVLEKQLRNYSALTKGDTLMVQYIGRKYYLDVLECKPAVRGQPCAMYVPRELGVHAAVTIVQDAVCIIETDVVVDFAPPLDMRAGSAAARAPSGAAGATASPALGSAAAPVDLTGSSSPLLGAAAGAAKSSAEPATKKPRPADGVAAAGSASPAAAAPSAAKFVAFAGPGRKLADGPPAGGVAESKGGASPMLRAAGAPGSPALGPKPVSAGGVLLSGGAPPAKERTLNRFEAAKKAQAFQGTARSLRE